MNRGHRWSRILVIVGLVAMIVGIVDPLEGSLFILAGIAIVTLGALLGKSPHRRWLLWSFVLVTVGVAALWGLSAVGGIGGHTGRSYWWALTLLPYPVGWVLGLVGAFRCLRKPPSVSVPPSHNDPAQ